MKILVNRIRFGEPSIELIPIMVADSPFNYSFSSEKGGSGTITVAMVFSVEGRDSDIKVLDFRRKIKLFENHLNSFYPTVEFRHTENGKSGWTPIKISGFHVTNRKKMPIFFTLIINIKDLAPEHFRVPKPL